MGPPVVNSVTWPSVVILPITLSAGLVNHSAPSGPRARDVAPWPYSPHDPHGGRSNSVIRPDVVIVEMRALYRSENHSAPSGPFTMASG